jgi:hypothetical protein
VAARRRGSLDGAGSAPALDDLPPEDRPWAQALRRIVRQTPGPLDGAPALEADPLALDPEGDDG